MKTILTIILALIMLGCEGKDMAHIGEEVGSTLVDTNVTDGTQVYDTTGITATSKNGFSSYYLKDGTMWVCGYNSYGQLGGGLTTNVYRPSFIETNTTEVKSVFSGKFTAFIIKTDGTLWATGRNENGQLGIGTFENTNIFTYTGIDDAKSVITGEAHSLIIKTDGTLWVTGLNAWGELGLGLADNAKVNIFTKTNESNVLSGSAGYFSSAIIKTDGTLWVAGSNSDGQLGLGDNTNRNTFAKTTLENVNYVSMGYDFTAIINTENEVVKLKTTGKNDVGQLGLNDFVFRNTFTDTGVTVAEKVECGFNFTALLRNGNSLFTTGGNSDGQLGLGDNTDRDIFTDTSVSGITSMTAAAKGISIIKTDGTLWATGDNFAGQLGLGDTTDRNSFESTLKVPDEFIYENWTNYAEQKIVQKSSYLYLATLIGADVPSPYVSLTEIGVTNPLKPFDNQNITPAISSSPMTYTITGTEEFNAFTLAKVLATSITYTFALADTTVIKTATTAIDVKRDADGILSDYPTTVTFYAGQQMPAGSAVSIELTYSADVELGDFTLNNMIDSGFTKLSFSHGIQDYNNYTPDAWGQIAESVKAIVTTFNINIDVPLTNYDYAVSFNESIAGKNVTIDASDSNGAVADGESIFASLTRRVRVINPVMKSTVKDGDLGKMATLTMEAQEIV